MLAVWPVAREKKLPFVHSDCSVRKSRSKIARIFVFFLCLRSGLHAPNPATLVSKSSKAFSNFNSLFNLFLLSPSQLSLSLSSSSSVILVRCMSLQASIAVCIRLSPVRRWLPIFILSWHGRWEPQLVSYLLRLHTFFHDAFAISSCPTDFQCQLTAKLFFRFDLARHISKCPIFSVFVIPSGWMWKPFVWRLYVCALGSYSFLRRIAIKNSHYFFLGIENANCTDVWIESYRVSIDNCSDNMWWYSYSGST